MVKSKTGSFYLTAAVPLAGAAATGTRNQGEIDLGAYVSVPQGMAIAVESVDFIYQNDTTFDSNAEDMVTGSGTLTVQLTDLNPGTVFVRADNQSLIASGACVIDKTNNIVSHMTDLYPDNFGPAKLSESFFVVNDTMYLVFGNDGTGIGAGDVYVTARIRCRVVSLDSKAWMAIAIQATASD